jgi:bifunctional UDP-N-acetylglucosamine pyrophosphorylase/glucosamine-1-phosphate N-acetyltransferase
LQPNNAANEYYLTDMVEILIREGFRILDMHVKDSSELLGINNRAELARVDRIFRERKALELMLAGVTIEKPETVTIDAEVQVGMDTVIEPFVQLRGKTIVGEGCRIGACSVVSGSVLGDGVHIGPFTVIGDSRLEEGSQAGPFSRLRMGSHVEAGAHIGNFVELKKTRMGAGAKANHLAYLGDSDIGARTNIGAGTITCNYDGVLKHKTKIGSNAFVGSNSTLVAPLEIAGGAYVAAGSVLTKSVPEDALAIGRARQENKEGYAKKLRKT